MCYITIFDYFIFGAFIFIMLFKRIIQGNKKISDYKKVQYFDRVTLLMSAYMVLRILYWCFCENTVKIISMIFGIVYYLCARCITNTALSVSEQTEFDANPEYNLYFRGEWQIKQAIKLYFSPLKQGRPGTQYYCMELSKAIGTILMTGVIPELFIS